jgi:hypothetical protein
MRAANPLSGAVGSVCSEPGDSGSIDRVTDSRLADAGSGPEVGPAGSGAGRPTNGNSAAGPGCGLEVGMTGASLVGTLVGSPPPAVGPPIVGPASIGLSAGGASVDGSGPMRATTGSSTVNGGGITEVRG